MTLFRYFIICTQTTLQEEFLNIIKVRLKSHIFIYQYWAIYKTKVFRYDKEYGLAKKFNIKRTCTIICEYISLLIRLFTGYLQIYVGCLNSIRRKINKWFLFRYVVGVSEFNLIA